MIPLADFHKQHPLEDLRTDGSPAYTPAYTGSPDPPPLQHIDEAAPGRDLAHVATAWPHLPGYIRAAILSLIDTAAADKGGQA